MSNVYENRQTIRNLRNLINLYKPTNNETIYYFVFGYPRSDIGKGTLVAQLLANTENSDAIKFDGLLNTNANGRHTASGHDDFGIYEAFNAGKDGVENIIFWEENCIEILLKNMEKTKIYKLIHIYQCM